MGPLADNFFNPQILAQYGPSILGGFWVTIEVALLTAVRDERRACVAECARRAELWEKTGDKADASAPIRAEARARAAEAHYLGDLMATRR